MKSLEHYWYQSNYFVWLLLPLSWIYCLIAFIRRQLYQLNIFTSYSATAPVIVIGNIVAGGSGKTPLLITMCDYLQQNGYKPGVVSRGYGGSLSGIKQVLASDSARLVGDEPLMICQRTKVPVVVGADRVAAVDYLLKNNQCEVVLSDDGLQHYRMKRSIEIAVIDAQRMFGNGFCLPAGPLRERITRLNDVDLVVYSGETTKNSDECSYTLQIVELRQLNGNESRSMASFLPLVNTLPVHAVAGIGFPARFFTQLRDNGLNIIEHAFPDHHAYRQEDFFGWETECIIMTEKDAVKCSHLSLNDAWVVIVKATLSRTLESQLNSYLLPLLKHKIH